MHVFGEWRRIINKLGRRDGSPVENRKVDVKEEYIAEKIRSYVQCNTILKMSIVASYV